MADDGEWLIYGCEVAKGDTGRAFVQALRELTGLNIAAASHKVGTVELGGSWILDDMSILTNTMLKVSAWQGLLAGTLEYDTKTFLESVDNDGSITTTATITLTDDTFTTSDFNGDNVTDELDNDWSNLVNGEPDGLTAVLMRTSDTTATLSFTGNAYANSHDINTTPSPNG